MCCKHPRFNACLGSYRVSHNDVMLSDNCDRLSSRIERLEARRGFDASSKRLLGVVPRDRWRLDFVALDSDASRRSEKVEG